MPKKHYYYLKNCKNRQALGAQNANHVLMSLETLLLDLKSLTVKTFLFYTLLIKNFWFIIARLPQVLTAFSKCLWLAAGLSIYSIF